MLRSLLAQRSFIAEKKVTPTQCEFTAACSRIENDTNFREKFCEEELLRMIMGTNDDCKSISAVVVIKSTLPGPDNKGQVYEIKTAQWEHINYDFSINSRDMKPVILPDPTILLVDKHGKYSFHYYGPASRCDFNHPLTDLDISHYLVDIDNTSSNIYSRRAY